MKKILYFIVVVTIVFFSIFLLRSWQIESAYNELIAEINTVKKHDFEVDNSSVFTFRSDGFKCFLPNEPTIQELNTSLISGKHFFALDSINYFLYSINITYNDAGINIDDYGDNETFLTTYFDRYLKETRFLVDPNILTHSNIKFKSKYSGIEYQIISDELNSPIYQYGVFFIKDEHIFKIAINFPGKSRHLAYEKYEQLIASFNFLGQK